MPYPPLRPTSPSPLDLAPPTPARTAALDRRRWCLGAAAWAGLAGCSTLSGRPTTPADDGRGVVPFSNAPSTGALPAGWHELLLRRDLPNTRYELVDMGGRRVLHALADQSTSVLRCDVSIDPRRQPWLDWDWRAEQVDTRATVADDALDDCPVRLLVGFDGDPSGLSLRDRLFSEQVELFTGHTVPYATLTYVWDGQAPVGSVFSYARTSRVRYLVVESGDRHAGRWRRYRRNVVDDYRRVYGGEPGRIISVGLITDSDDLKTRTEAWVGDLRFG